MLNRISTGKAAPMMAWPAMCCLFGHACFDATPGSRPKPKDAENASIIDIIHQQRPYLAQSHTHINTASKDHCDYCKLLFTSMDFDKNFS